MGMSGRTADGFVRADGFNATPSGYVTKDICKDPISDDSIMSDGANLVRLDTLVQIDGQHQGVDKHGLARGLYFTKARQTM